MKQLWMIAVILTLCGAIGMTSCSKEDDGEYQSSTDDEQPPQKVTRWERYRRVLLICLVSQNIAKNNAKLIGGSPSVIFLTNGFVIWNNLYNFAS